MFVNSYAGNYRVPMYIINDGEVEFYDYAVMEFYTEPMYDCIEVVSKYRIYWCKDLDALKERGFENGTLHVLLSDFNKSNRVDEDIVQEYMDNFENSRFYKDLKKYDMVDFELPSKKSL